jgi:hypothetical protein
MVSNAEGELDCMAFAVDMEAAARRHLEAANCLMECGCRSVAGYIYGLAAECAAKAMLRGAGVGPPRNPRDHDNPYFKHFPELRSVLRDRLQGKRARSLATFINDDRFMANWSVEMRYSDGKAIKAQWVKAWAEQARQIIASIGT